MPLLITGVVGFVLGVMLILIGRAVVAREIRRRRGAAPKELMPFLRWLLLVVKKEWPILTGAHSLVGERIAAAGSILSAVSLIAMLGGIIAIVLQSAP